MSYPYTEIMVSIPEFRDFGVWGSKIGFPVPKMYHFPVPENPIK